MGEKSMKKRFLIVLILTFALSLVLCACGSDGEKEKDFTDDAVSIETMRAISIINSNLSGNIFKLGDKHDSSEDAPEGFVYTPGFGMYGLQSEDEYTRYDVHGFPDVIDSWVVAGISGEVNSPIKLFGFGIGDKLVDLEKELIDAGFSASDAPTLVWFPDSSGRQHFCIDALSVNVYYDEEGAITQIGIGLGATNKGNVMF
jgi:hypothetical protein